MEIKRAGFIDVKALNLMDRLQQHRKRQNTAQSCPAGAAGPFDAGDCNQKFVYKFILMEVVL